MQASLTLAVVFVTFSAYPLKHISENLKQHSAKASSSGKYSYSLASNITGSFVFFVKTLNPEFDKNKVMHSHVWRAIAFAPEEHSVYRKGIGSVCQLCRSYLFFVAGVDTGGSDGVSFPACWIIYKHAAP